MKQLITLIALLFPALSFYGQGKQIKIHREFGKVLIETNLIRSELANDKIRESPRFQDKMNFYQNTRPKSDQETNQRIDSLIIQAWDENSSQWNIVFKEEFTYDARGNMTQSLPYGGGQTVAEWKSEYIHDANGNKTQYLSYYWDESLNKWVQYGKEGYTYDADGNMTQSDGYGWDESTSKWLVTYITEYTYDAHGNMIQSVERGWDGFSNEWVTLYKHEYSYNAKGDRIQSTGNRWDESTGTWVPIDKLEYIYNASDNITQSLYHCWDESTSKFVNCWKEEYSHDEEGNIIQNHLYEWYDETAHLLARYEYTYDNLYARSELILPYFNDEISIIEGLDITHLFDHKMVSFAASNWLEANSEWSPQIKGDYYYSEQNISSVNETGIEISSIYPNPCSDYITFSFPTNINQLTFVLFDLQGRKLMTKTIHNNETISLEGLDNGLYVFELLTQGGNKKSGLLIKE